MRSAASHPATEPRRPATPPVGDTGHPFPMDPAVDAVRDAAATAPGRLRRPGDRERRRNRLHVAIFVVVLGALCAAYLAAPEGAGGLAFFGTALCGLVAFAVGPLVHRPVRTRPWRWLAVAGAMFLTSLVLRLELFEVPGPVGAADLWSFAGYACTVGFLVGLLRRTHPGRDPMLWLDTAAVTVGSALIGWVMNVGPELDRPHLDLGNLLVVAGYPVADTLLLTLTVQLWLRRGASAPALQAALAGLTAMLVGDLAYTFVWAADPGALSPTVNVCYMIAFACLGAMAAHPSMRELSDVDVRRPVQTTRARLALVLIAMLTPASVPVMLPTHGLLDGTVRAGLMAVFAGLVFLRLLGTLRALQRARAEAQYRATHDLLTGLPNRAALLYRLDQHLTDVRTAGEGGWVNVFSVDCDHFTHINDSWGHAAGDEVLVQLAGRLRSVVRAGDLLARSGGDEFVLRIDTDSPEQATAVAERIMAAFAEPLTISAGRPTLLTASIGVAQAPHRAHTRAADLLRDADVALSRAKADGRDAVAVYDASMHERVIRRLELADALRGALGRGEIHVAFQPIRGGADYGELLGWEALARWDHPELGSVSPGEFVPIAEDTGLIVDIGAFVMEHAAAHLRRWQHRFGRSDLHVSVNVSSVQLLRDDVVGLVDRVLTDNGLTPQSLWLEITESVVLDRTEDAVRILNELADLGVKLSLDDFGTGYSSLSYLKDFTLHVLKIDRAFVRNIDHNTCDRELTKAIVGVAGALRLEGVVAEGVETMEQARVLGDLGCEMVQGYLYGRPLPPQEAEAAAAELLGAATPVRAAAAPRG